MIFVSGSKLTCSFCGTSEDKADLVFARNGSQICSACVTQAHAAMRGARVGPFYSCIDGGGPAPRRSRAFDKIAAGLDDAIAFARGDTSRATVHVIHVRGRA